ncbi:Lsr2 family protein [Corynebacterium accolens]|uniref:histone-like nucleoid-structuring protein Lsr2 n=1 Tax=Corynebacterium accolens TaxID=38284 RepID=UPI002543B3FC|nr:Lsr2 family protein [Corynebacterium accolens]MDK4209791.1 Lsr2 family protein [Corynebacterium accolens]
MARREITQFYDDLDNQLIGEDELEAVRFSVNGRSYLMDLSRDNARRFHEAIAPFVEAAHAAPDAESPQVDPRKVREWAQKQGHDVARRGKIPQNIIDAYNAAH